MGWIDINDKYPPRGLEVLLEVSGRVYGGSCSMIADHSFHIGCWIVPKGDKEGHWLIYDNCGDDDGHIAFPEVHAWMPLPRHFAPNELFTQEEDLMEHPMFDEEPEWLYKGDCVYEQMSLDEYLADWEQRMKEKTT